MWSRQPAEVQTAHKGRAERGLTQLVPVGVQFLKLLNISRIYRKRTEKNKTEKEPSKWQFFEQKCLVNARSQGRMARLL